MGRCTGVDAAEEVPDGEGCDPFSFRTPGPLRRKEGLAPCGLLAIHHRGLVPISASCSFAEIDLSPSQ